MQEGLLKLKDSTMPTEYGEPVDEEGGRQNTKRDVSIISSSTIMEKATIALAIGVGKMYG